MGTGKLKQRKAWLAIAFASGMIASQLPALAENNSPTPNSVIQEITDDPRMTPDVKAYFLLKLAERYLSDDNRSEVEKQFTPEYYPSGRLDNFKRWETCLSIGRTTQLCKSQF